MPHIKARAEAARCLEMASRARRRFMFDAVHHSPWPQRRGDQLSAMDWLREARYWLRVAHQLP